MRSTLYQEGTFGKSIGKNSNNEDGEYNTPYLPQMGKHLSQERGEDGDA